MNKKIQCLILTTTLAATSAVQAQVSSLEMRKEFVSPNQVVESCFSMAKLPLGEYKEKDLEEEKRLCSLDFHNNTVALCAKTWSTSPGTIINDFSGLASSSAQAELNYCNGKSKMKTLAKFKQTMNQADTSGTFSASSILYYHMSRVLDTAVTVPVAVYRSMDKDSHYARVSAKANPPANAKMNVAGWNWIKSSEQNPDVYRPTRDLYTTDKRQIYGALLKDKGARYGVEINGTRASGWGQGQNFDFQKTPGFLALKSSAGTLAGAIQDGITKAFADSAMAKGFSSGKPSDVQMVLWMNELSEIAILDYIFSQQDRVGNVDFQWHWVYSEGGEAKSIKVSDARYEELSRSSMGKIPVPAELAGKSVQLVQKTSIGDNDAGGLVSYANFTKSTGMLQGAFGKTSPMAHLNKKTYQKLLKLARDFKNKGENYKLLESETIQLGYNDQGNKRFTQLINNTIQAAQIFETNCQSGILKLDLVSFKSAVAGNLQAEATNCNIQD